MINKTKLFEWYVAQEARFNTGQGKVIQFKHAFQLYLLADVYLVVKFDINIALYFLIFASVGFILLFWLMGFVWDKLGLFHYQAEFGNKRNPAIKQIRKKLNLKEKVVLK